MFFENQFVTCGLFPAHSRRLEGGFRGRGKGDVLWESESHMVGILGYILPDEVRPEENEFDLVV